MNSKFFNAVSKIRYLALLMFLTLITTHAWGAEGVIYTLEPASGSNNSYAGDCDVIISSITWNITGNSTTQPWRIGGKSLSNVDRAVYSKTAISENVTKIEVIHGAASSITVNSMTVIVSKNSNFSSPVSTLTPSFAANNTVTINRPDGKDWSNCYYKIVYNVSVSGNTNRYIQFTRAKFYAEAGSSCSAPAAPTISGTDSYTAGETITLTASCASGTDASTTYAWYKGADWATARAASPVQAAATGSSGYTFTKASCTVDDAGTYWCEASNGSGCETHNSTGKAITVSAGGGGGGGDCDVLNRELTGVTNGTTSYSNWSNKSGSSSDAVYAGNSAGGNDAIQLRSNNSNSGIVTTTSGGTASSISVTWNSNTASGRTINIYGKNSAYSAATDLYSDATAGTLIGTIVKGTNTSLDITGSYEYIGICSASGALYLDEVNVCWETCDALGTINGSISLTAKNSLVDGYKSLTRNNFRVRQMLLCPIF